MILSHLANPRAGALKEAGKVAARIDTEAHQHQRAKQREQRLFAGQHHDAGLAELVDGIKRDQTTQILHHFQRPGEANWADVRGPEQIAVGCFVNLFQRVF